MVKMIMVLQALSLLMQHCGSVVSVLLTVVLPQALMWRSAVCVAVVLPQAVVWRSAVCVAVVLPQALVWRSAVCVADHGPASGRGVGVWYL